MSGTFENETIFSLNILSPKRRVPNSFGFGSAQNVIIGDMGWYLNVSFA